MKTHAVGLSTRLFALGFAALLTGRVSAQVEDAATPSNGSIAVVLSTQTKSLNVPTVTFYRSVLNELTRSRKWRSAPQSIVSAHLPKTDGVLGSVPAISRTEFLKAHPEAGKVEGAKSRKGGKVAPSVQEMLDTLALQGAVIVDCIPQGTHRVRSCGLFFYDRAAGKVVASLRKHFRVGIKDATRWAPDMVMGLYSGLEAHKSEAAKAKLAALIAASAEEQRTSRLEASFTAIGESITSPAPNLDVLPEVMLGVGSRDENLAIRLEAGYGATSARAEGAAWDLTSRRLGLGLGLHSRALDSLVWELDWSLGVVERKLTRSGDEDSLLRHREIYMALRPGAMWDVGSGWLLGSHFGFTRYMGGERVAKGYLQDDTLGNYGLGLSFGVRKLF